MDETDDAEVYDPRLMIRSAVRNSHVPAAKRFRVRVRYAGPQALLGFFGKWALRGVALIPVPFLLAATGASRLLEYGGRAVSARTISVTSWWLHIVIGQRANPGNRPPWQPSSGFDLRDDGRALRILKEEGLLDEGYARKHARVDF